jgi:hypothetical protein
MGANEEHGKSVSVPHKKFVGFVRFVVPISF